MKWICFSGIDGSGKTTLVNYAYRLLRKKYTVHKFKSPPTEWIGEMLQASGNGKPFGDVYTDHLIFTAALRAEMYNVKRSAKRFQILLSEGSWLDQFPYRKVQGFGYRRVMYLLKPHHFLRPDVVFYLDCDPKKAYKWIIDSDGDKYETLSFVRKSRMEFKKFFRSVQNNEFLIKFPKTKIFKLDTAVPENELKQKVKQILKGERLA